MKKKKQLAQPSPHVQEQCGVWLSAKGRGKLQGGSNDQRLLPVTFRPTRPILRDIVIPQHRIRIAGKQSTLNKFFTSSERNTDLGHSPPPKSAAGTRRSNSIQVTLDELPGASKKQAKENLDDSYHFALLDDHNDYAEDIDFAVRSVCTRGPEGVCGKDNCMGDMENDISMMSRGNLVTKRKRRAATSGVSSKKMRLDPHRKEDPLHEPSLLLKTEERLSGKESLQVSLQSDSTGDSLEDVEATVGTIFDDEPRQAKTEWLRGVHSVQGSCSSEHNHVCRGGDEVSISRDISQNNCASQPSLQSRDFSVTKLKRKGATSGTLLKNTHLDAHRKGEGSPMREPSLFQGMEGRLSCRGVGDSTGDSLEDVEVAVATSIDDEPRQAKKGWLRGVHSVRRSRTSRHNHDDEVINFEDESGNNSAFQPSPRWCRQRESGKLSSDVSECLPFESDELSVDSWEHVGCDNTLSEFDEFTPSILRDTLVDLNSDEDFDDPTSPMDKENKRIGSKGALPQFVWGNKADLSIPQSPLFDTLDDFTLVLNAQGLDKS